MNVWIKFFAFQALTEAFLISGFYNKILKSRKCIKNSYISSLTIEIFLLLFTIYFKISHPIISYIFLQLSLLSPILLIYEDRLSKKICAFFLLIFGTMFAESFPATFFLIANTFFPDTSLLPYDLYSNGNIKLSALYTLLVLLTALLVFQFLAKLFQNTFALMKTKNLIFLFSPLVTMLVTTNGVFLTTDFFISFLPVTLIYWSCFFLCIPFFLSGYNDLKKQEEIAVYRKNQKVFLEQQLLHFKEVNTTYQNIRKWNHDGSNHLIAISYLIEKYDYEEAINYINQLLATRN